MGLNLNNYWWLSATSATLVLLLLWRYAYHSRITILDDQNVRSLHQGKTLTGAGVLMFVPWGLFGLFMAPLFIPFYVVLALSLLGFFDDRHDLSFKLRLLFQIVAAVVTLYAVGLDSPLWLFMLLTFCLLWWVNLFNFMDGANGMAALHGMVSIACYGLIFLDHFSQVTIFSYMSLSAVLILAVYLVFNLYLKKLFMGDSGSLALAWVIAVMALFSIHTNTLSMSQVAIIHAVFIVDATLTLLMRLRRGENVTQAHATHLYQRLIKSGRPHFTVSMVYAAFTLLCCLLVWLIQMQDWVVQYVSMMAVYLILVAVFMKYLNLRP